MTQEEVQSLLAHYWRPSSPVGENLWENDGLQIEAFFGCVLPPAFRLFRALLPHYQVEGGHLPLAEMRAVYESEGSDNPNFSRDHLPFYAVGNGDYVCLSLSACPESPVLYVAHDDFSVPVLNSSFEAFLMDPEWWE